MPPKKRLGSRANGTEPRSTHLPKGMDSPIMSTTPVISNDRLAKMSLSTERPRGVRANERIATALRIALAERRRGPKWVAKQLGLNKRRATMLVNGETVIFVADLVVLADALKIPATTFFEEI